MKNKINILIILVLVAALAGAGALVKKSQETRSGATFANVQALFLPAADTVAVGDKFITTLVIDASTHLLTGADLRVKYDPEKLTLDSTTVLTKENFTGGVVWLQNPDEVVVSEIDLNTGTFRLVGTNMQKEATNLPTGIINIVKLNFIAKANGQAEVTLDDSYGNIIAGYNSAGSDQELKIEKVTGASYTIAAAATVMPTVTGITTVNCGWCGSNCIDLNKVKVVCAQVYMKGKQCVNNNGSCVILTVTPEHNLVTPTTMLKKRVMLTPTVGPTSVPAGSAKTTPGYSIY